MSYVAIVAGILSAVQGVPGLTNAFAAEPQSVEAPAAYLLGQDGDGSDTGQLTSDLHRLIVRVAVRWTDPTVAEGAIRGFVDSVPAALRGVPTAGGATNLVYTGYKFGFWNVSGVLYRICDFSVTALDKRPH